MKWITFCSQTGGEIKELSSNIGKSPDVIVTNQPVKLDLGTLKWLDHNNIKIVVLPLNPTLEDYLSLDLDKYDLITLHGFLRIIPEEICKRYKIYNGHPGLISRNPELKGKDPQIKAFELKHRIIGSVVHIVTPVVDDGEIMWENYTEIEENSSLEEYYMELKKTSLNCWKQFLENCIKLN